MSLLRRLRALFRKEKLDTEMGEEMRAHLELQAAENERRGMAPEQAHFAARRAFGGVEQIKERARDERRRGFLWLEQLAQDLRFAARGLRKSPGFTAVAALTLAFGIGVNTSMFTALQLLLLRDLPLAEPERVVQIFRTSPHSQRWPHAPANFLEQQAGNEVFAAMAAVQGSSFNLADPGQPAERVSGRRLSAEIFPILAVQPLLGRAFTRDEDRPGATVIMLGHRFWQRRFAGDPGIVGRSLRLDGGTADVIGVLPPELRDVPLVGQVDVWRPIGFTTEQRANRSGNYLQALARLKPGVTLAQAQAAMDAFAARQARDHPETNSGIGLRLVPLADAMGPRDKLGLWLTMALAGLVLLIACANLANLQFARTARRTPELAIRGAMGAPRGRLLRQLLAESLLIAAGGGALGLVLAAWGNSVLNPQLFPSGEAVLTLNPKVLGFALLASTVAGLSFGLVPAWLASGADPNTAIKQGGRGAAGDRSRNRLQCTLVVVEVAVALVVLAGAGLVVRGLERFAVQPPGWEIDDLTVGSIDLPEAKYRSASDRRAFADRLKEKLETVPGVEEAVIASSLPLRPFPAMTSFTIAGRPAPEPGREPMRFLNVVTPGYFSTLRMRILEGRDFAATDAAGAPGVVIINETLARTFWPDASPLGARLGGEEIVGVVNDVRFPAEPNAPASRFQTYRPFAQDPPGSLSIALRGRVSAERLRHAVAEIDPDLPLNDVRPARAAVETSLARLGTMGWLLSGFGVLGLLLSSLGLYGVIAGFVGQRTREIGVRVALGAQLRDVLWLVVGKGLRLTLVGVALGLAGAFGVARVVASLVSEVEPNDLPTIATSAAVLTAVALLACWLPARRAARVDPMVALRSE
jgi:predicted permease